MKKLTDYYSKTLKVLTDLKKQHPNFGMGRHIATAFSDYGDTWGLSDKECFFALQKYKTQLELDIDETVSEDYVQQIMKDAEDLSTIFKEEEDDTDGY